MKVVLQRVEAKDYLDIAALIKAGTKLDQALSAAREMWGASFQPSECLKALVYFEGGDLKTLPRAIKETLIEAVSRVKTLPPISLASKKLSAME